MRSEKPICAPPRLSEVSPTSPFSSIQGRSSSASSFHGSLLQAIGGVMSLALCPQVVSQALQRFGSSKKQTTCEGCFARQSICSVISRYSGTGVFEGECQPLIRCSLGFPFHFSLFVASSLNLGGLGWLLMEKQNETVLYQGTNSERSEKR